MDSGIPSSSIEQDLQPTLGIISCDHYRYHFNQPERNVVCLRCPQGSNYLSSEVRPVTGLESLMGCSSIWPQTVLERCCAGKEIDGDGNFLHADWAGINTEHITKGPCWFLILPVSDTEPTLLWGDLCLYQTYHGTVKAWAQCLLNAVLDWSCFRNIHFRNV